MKTLPQKTMYCLYSQDAKENYESALKLYQDTLEQLIPILQSEPRGRRREVMNNEVQRYMGRAETIKQFLEVSLLPVLSTRDSDVDSSQNRVANFNDLRLDLTWWKNYLVTSLSLFALFRRDRSVKLPPIAY